MADKRKRPKATPDIQEGRLGGRLNRQLSNILDRTDYDVSLDPSAIAPERALVFELIGSVANFVNTAKRIELEWLQEQLSSLEGVEDYLPGVSPASIDDDEDEDHDEESVVGDADVFDLLVDEEDESLEWPGRLYVGMPTLATFKKLRNLWAQYRKNLPAPPNHSDWWDLFAKLHDIRPWGPEDRVSPHLITHLQRHLTARPGVPVNVEVDLWYRHGHGLRDDAEARLSVVIKDLGGCSILDQATLPEIRYQAALVRLTAKAAQDLAGLQGPIAHAHDVMTIRPQAMFQAEAGQAASDTTVQSKAKPDPDKPAIAALIDGYPIESHELLKGRLDIVELDVLGGSAPVNRRYHGTAMASLIIHGDGASNDRPISRVLKVVPVLQPDANGHETPPPDKLALAVIERAVRELKKGSQGQSPSGKDVIVINHSVCDEAGPFMGSISPWARLLDYLAFEYKVLFIVSAGNIKAPFGVGGYPDIASFRASNPDDRAKAIMLGLDGSKALRSLLTPAEAVNVLTVGALHSDFSNGVLGSTATDPYPHVSYPNLGSGVGLGFDRSVKPEMLMPGGRQVAAPSLTGGLQVHAMEAGAFGQMVACPSPTGKLSASRRCSGTSNAAALATRAAIQIADVLDEVDLEEGSDIRWSTRPTAPCAIKALLVHSSAWGEAGKHLSSFLPPISKYSRQREGISRYLGYGSGDLSRVIDGDNRRVTMLAEGEIKSNKRHEYRVPLPEELSSRTDLRRVVLTLAWLSPIKPESMSYKAMRLNLVGSDGNTKIWPGVKRLPSQPPVGVSRKGTCMHMIYEGRRAIPFLEDDDFVVNVQAAHAAGLTGMTQIPIPYAVAITFEVAASLNADIATSIRDRLKPKVYA